MMILQESDFALRDALITLKRSDKGDWQRSVQGRRRVFARRFSGLVITQPPSPYAELEGAPRTTKAIHPSLSGSRLDAVSSFIEEVREIDDAAVLKEYMDTMTRKMGFAYFLIYRSSARQNRDRFGHMGLGSYPIGFFKDAWRGEAHFDPVVKASARTATGFRWEDIPNIIPLSPKQVRILEMGRRYGLGHGFTVPYHIPGDPSGFTSFVCAIDTPYPEYNQGMAQLVGSFAYEAARRIWLRSEGLKLRADRVELTPRQLDCLILVAHGKTNWEIAIVLGLRESTVEGYIDDAKAALGVTRRSQLVTRALFEGFLSLSETVDVPKRIDIGTPLPLPSDNRESTKTERKERAEGGRAANVATKGAPVHRNIQSFGFSATRLRDVYLGAEEQIDADHTMGVAIAAANDERSSTGVQSFSVDDYLSTVQLSAVFSGVPSDRQPKD